MSKKGSKAAPSRLYHCDYCKADLSSQIRVRCAAEVCDEFDLCVNCFYEGVETGPHRNDHPYCVINDSRTPLYCANWSGDEELLLLEGIQRFGLGNWRAVSEHVNTKNQFQCEYHYWATYVDVSTFPLPQARRNKKDNKLIKEPARMTAEHVKKDDRGMLYSIMKKINLTPYEVAQQGKFECVKKGKNGEPIGSEVGYLPLRRGFTTEHYDDVETNIAKIHLQPEFQLKSSSYDAFTRFYPADSEYPPGSIPKNQDRGLSDFAVKPNFGMEEEPRELKQSMLLVYDYKISERERRNKFVMDNELFDFNKYRKVRKKLTKEEKEVYDRNKKFRRFMKPKEHEEYLKGLLKEVRLTRVIQLLQQYRRNGIRTIAQAKKYEYERQLRDQNRTQAAASAGVKKKKKKTVTQESSFNLKILEEFDSGESVVEILGEKEAKMIHSLEIPISQYLLMKDIMIKESHRIGYLTKGSAARLFMMDPKTVGIIYDFCVYCGWVNPDVRKMAVTSLFE